MQLDVLKQRLEDSTITVVHKDKRRENVDCGGYELLRYILEDGCGDEYIEAFSDKIGDFEFITQDESEYANADHYTTYIFKIDNVFYALDTWYNSWDGGEFDVTKLYEVTPVPKTITVYEAKK